MPQTRFNIEIIQLLMLVGCIGAGAYGYHRWDENQKRERDELLAKREVEKEKERADAAIAMQERDAQRKHQEEMEKMQMEAALKQKEVERLAAERFNRQMAADRAAEDARLKERQEQEKRDREAQEERLRAVNEAGAKAAAEIEEKKKAEALAEQKGIAIRLRELATRKTFLEGQVIATKNKINGAQRDQARAAGQYDEATHPSVMIATDSPIDHRTGSAGSVANNVDNREGVAKAVQNNQAALNQEADSRRAKMTFEQQLMDVNQEIAKLNERKKALDEQLGPVAPVAPAKSKPKKGIVYVLNDGTRIEAQSAMQADDNYILKIGDGTLKTIKKSDVKDLIYPPEE